MNKYFYRIAAESSIGRAIRSFHRHCQKAEQAQHKYAKQMGAEAFYEDFKHFAGGVSALVFRDTDDVNPNIWHFVGVAENGDRTYLPNVVTTRKTLKLHEGQALPKSSSHRVYVSKEQIGHDGQRTIQYIDVDPACASASKREKLRAVTSEVLRLRLPVVPISAFFRIVFADIPSDDDSVKITTPPVFFLYHNTYYVGLEFPIHYDGVEEITSGQYITAKNDLTFAERLMRQ